MGRNKHQLPYFFKRQYYRTGVFLCAKCNERFRVCQGKFT